MKTRQWIQKRPTTLNILQGLGFITYVCFISIHAYSDHESPKKIRFALRKSLKLKNSKIRPTRQHKKDTIQTPGTSPSFDVCYKLRVSSIGRVCKRSPAPMVGKIFEKIDFNLKKNRERFHLFFFLKTLRKTPSELYYHVSDTPIF